LPRQTAVIADMADRRSNRPPRIRVRRHAALTRVRRARAPVPHTAAFDRPESGGVNRARSDLLAGAADEVAEGVGAADGYDGVGVGAGVAGPGAGLVVRKGELAGCEACGVGADVVWFVLGLAGAGLVALVALVDEVVEGLCERVGHCEGVWGR
jgi:hypothetical protein